MSYFTIKELTYSKTAHDCGIDNTPRGAVVRHLETLIIHLSSLREMWGSAIRVTSGYRCPQLNRKVGGVWNSDHQFGHAADLYPMNGDWDGFVECVKRWAQCHKGIFDQIIIEKSKAGGHWVHFSVAPRRRGMLFGMTVN